MISEHRRRRFEWVVNKSTVNSNSCCRLYVLVFSSLRFLSHKRSSRDVLATSCCVDDAFCLCFVCVFLDFDLFRRFISWYAINSIFRLRCLRSDFFLFVCALFDDFCFCDFDHEHLARDALDEHVDWLRDCRDSWVIQWMNIQTSN